MRAAIPFHVMTKPIGPICNLDCTYCFYLEKEKLVGDGSWRMKPEVLDTYVRQYIEAQPTETVTFAWQGGEPTLMGVDFFREVVSLQKKYGLGRIIENALQTNGTLLDAEWGEFLHEHRFLVGLSVDGPARLHDAFRVDKGGEPTFDRVMRGLELLHKHQVEFNTLTVVHRRNSKKPLEVYRFLKEIGSKFMQFIPIVEREASPPLKKIGLDLEGPPDHDRPSSVRQAPVTPWSVRPEEYGDFLIAIFDDWVRTDVGQVFVQIFDVALSNWAGAGSVLCVFAPTCGAAMALEHNGDLYSCDHFVYPAFKLGNLMQSHLGEMAMSDAQRAFGQAKSALPAYCRACNVRFACHGECPKHRFLLTPAGEPGLNYLCKGYKKFFSHIDEPMRMMASLLAQRRAPAEVMRWIADKNNASVAGGR